MAEYTFLPDAATNKIGYVIEIILKEARKEDKLVRDLFYTMLSMYTNDPRNLRVESPTGEGKSYVTKKVGDMFPKEDVIKFVGMSEKSIFHRPGKLVIRNDSGDYEEIESIIERLDEQIQDKQNEFHGSHDINLKQGLKAQIKDLEAEKKDIANQSKKLIDLSHKCIILLDTPDAKLLGAIMPLASHDEYEVEYEYVDTSNGIKTKTNILRGWPVVIYAAAIDFSHYKRYPEIQRRFPVTNPRMDREKYQAAVDLTFDKYCLPDFAYQNKIVSDEEKQQAREIIKGFKERILGISSNVRPGRTNVVIPFEKAIRTAYTGQRASDMTNADRICGYLTLLAAVNVEDRPFINYRREGSPILQKIPLATFDDLKEALFLVQDSSGVRPYILEWYYDVFLPTYDSMIEPNSRVKDKDRMFTETRIALSVQQLADATFDIRSKKVTTGQIRDTYLDQLMNEGYIDNQPSELDRRSSIYFPVIRDSKKVYDCKKSTVSVESCFFPTQNVIRSSIQALLEKHDGDMVLELDDLDGVIERYYSKPDDVFSLKNPILSTKDESYIPKEDNNNPISLKGVQIKEKKEKPEQSCNRVVWCPIHYCLRRFDNQEKLELHLREEHEDASRAEGEASVGGV